MPHEVPDFIRAFGHNNEQWLLDRYAELFDELANLPAHSHRVELVNSQMGDVLTQLSRQAKGQAERAPNAALHRLCDQIQEALGDPAQSPPELVQPNETVYHAIAEVLRERGQHRADLHSLGTRTGQRGAVAAGREGSFRRGVIYARRSY
ncbi:hypothetical protein JCM10449v2_007481 [Rhodotorula kratochvilovae]